jgi:hypothetical protein
MAAAVAGSAFRPAMVDPPAARLVSKFIPVTSSGLVASTSSRLFDNVTFPALGTVLPSRRSTL